MRIIIIISLLLLPLSIQAQINRSATELAQETTREYIITKIFKGKIYQPVSYDVLKPWPDTRSPVSWLLSHQFTITEKQRSGFDNSPAVPKKYSFTFYLDSKMKVLWAACYTAGD